MENQTKFEMLLNKARMGDVKAETDFFSELVVRFLPLVTGELQKHALLKESINISEKSREVCHTTIINLKRLYPLASTEWSLKRAMIVLRNDIDDAIIKLLAERAKKSNGAAENLLFRKLREKLMRRITYQKGRFASYESKNE